MEHAHGEKLVLRLLAKEWAHSGPPGIMEIAVIVSCLYQAPSETLAAIKSLYQSGLLDMNALATSAFLTPEGHEIAENL